jgi:hypothetical protein
MSGASDIYRDRASLGHLPVLRGQTLMEEPYRLQADANATALWWFDEPRGVTVFDKKGTNDITLVHAPTWGTGGPFGCDLDFDGSNDYGTCSSTIDFTTAFTIEAIVKMTSVGGGTEGMVVQASSGGSSAPNYGNIWRMSIGWEDDMGCLFYNGTALQSCQSTTTVVDGTYHYLVARLGSNVIDLFKDGVNVGTANVSGSVAASSNTSIAIARNAVFAGYHDGGIAMIRLSAIARPNAEILTNAKLMGFA